MRSGRPFQISLPYTRYYHVFLSDKMGTITVEWKRAYFLEGVSVF